nr:butyrophilin subfamily 3 member A1-like [Chrysemys picta bellii]
MELRGQLSSCLFCAILLSVIPFSESFEVNSSPTVTGIVGQDVVLPCHISTRTQPNNMEVQWKKIIQAHIETVYEYRAETGQDVPGPNYRSRTVLLKDGFTSGNVSLKLKNVRPADGGTYSCIVKSNEWSADAATELQIAAVASVSIDVLGPQGQGIDLACRSTGWFPKPELHWVTKNRQDLQPVTKTEQDHELLFSVLSQVTILGEETGEISCVIQNSLLKTEQKSVILLSGDIFPHGSPWLAAFWVLFTLNLLAMGACAFWGYKVKQARSKKKRSKEETLFLWETEKTTLESERAELLERLGRAVTELDFRKVQSYMVPITLDPSYKHPELTVSADGRRVWHNPSSQGSSAPSGTLIAVGREEFMVRRDHGGEGGVCKWYWEVEIGDSPDWELGVLNKTVRERVRQEKLERLPEGGCWALGRSGGWYHPKEADTVIKNWDVKPTVVGVYLDLEEGNLSFYSVNSMALILEIPVKGLEIPVKGLEIPVKGLETPVKGSEIPVKGSEIPVKGSEIPVKGSEILVKGLEGLFPFLSPGHAAGRDQGKPLSICPPRDWDFFSGSVSQGAPRTPAHPTAPNNGEGAENNTGLPATEETIPAPGQRPAPEDQVVKGKRAGQSVIKFLRKPLSLLKGDKTEQEHLPAEEGTETPNPEISNTHLQETHQAKALLQGKRNRKEKNTQNLNPERISGADTPVLQISESGNMTRQSDPNTDTLERTLPHRESRNGDTSDVSSPLNSKENCSD